MTRCYSASATTECAPRRVPSRKSTLTSSRRSITFAVGACALASSATASRKTSRRGRSVAVAARFDCTLFSFEIGLAKPDPAIYLEATRRLGVSASETWFIGDGQDDELAGCRTGGASFVPGTLVSETVVTLPGTARFRIDALSRRRNAAFGRTISRTRGRRAHARQASLRSTTDDATRHSRDPSVGCLRSGSPRAGQAECHHTRKRQSRNIRLDSDEGRA